MRVTRIYAVLVGLFILVQGLGILLRDWRGILPGVAWNISDRTWNRYEIRATTLDSQGEAWFIAQKLSRQDTYELRHITGNQVVSWELPSVTFEEIEFAAIAPAGTPSNPWLVLGKRLAHWDGTHWTFVPMPLQADLKSFLCPSIVNQGAIVWGMDNAAKSTRLIRLELDQDPIQAQEITLPQQLSSESYKIDCIVPLTQESLLVAVGNGVQVDLYQLRDLEWQRLTSFQKQQTSNLYVADLTIDPGGRIWVLLHDWIRGKPVGKYDPQEKTWTWYDLESQPEVANLSIEYGHIAADEHGRVWLSARQYGPKAGYEYSYDTDVVGVFEETPDHKLAEIRHYTAANSSLETSLVAKIILGPDKKIWTWNRQLVWMDSSQQVLPQLAPGWFVTAANPKIHLVLALLIVVPMTIVVIIVIRQRRRGNSNTIS